MKEASVKLILCDLGNVLVNFDHRRAVRRILPFCDKSFDEVHQLFFDSPLTKEYEEGRVSSGDFFERMCRTLACTSLTYDDFSSIWSEIFFASDEMVVFLEEIKKDFRLHLVSNINELHYRYIRKNFVRHLNVFDRVILSCEVGYRKPHPAIYGEALAASDTPRSQVLYIDDREDLVLAARDMGIPSIVFQDTAQCRRAFNELGIWPKTNKSS